MRGCLSVRLWLRIITQQTGAVWSAGFGLGTVAMFLNRKSEAMLFAVAWAIGTAFLLLTCARLKRVKLAGATLVISNFRHDTTVPVSEIAD
jgi:hypothetical protein